MNLSELEQAATAGLTFEAFREANVTRCLRWHPEGIESWSSSDWLTAVTGELGELASLIKMRNRERDGLPGNKFSPTQKDVADEIADVFIYLDLLAAREGVNLADAVVSKFNEVSERVGFPDRIVAARNALRPMLELLADLDLLKPPHSDECGCDQCEAYLSLCADRDRILKGEPK